MSVKFIKLLLLTPLTLIINHSLESGIFTSLIFIYINDLTMFNDRFNVLMYADDSNLYANLEYFSSASLENEINLNPEKLNTLFLIGIVILIIYHARFREP